MERRFVQGTTVRHSLWVEGAPSLASWVSEEVLWLRLLQLQVVPEVHRDEELGKHFGSRSELAELAELAELTEAGPCLCFRNATGGKRRASAETSVI